MMMRAGKIAILLMICMSPCMADTTTSIVMTDLGTYQFWSHADDWSETFSNIQAGIVPLYLSGSSDCRIKASATTNEFQYISRNALKFDTSAIPSNQTIKSAAIRFRVFSMDETLSSDDLVFVEFSPFSKTMLAAADYREFSPVDSGHISTSEMDASNWYTVNFTNFDLIDLGEITYLGYRMRADINNAPYTWSAGAPSISVLIDNTGANKPILDITYGDAEPVGNTSSLSVNLLEKYSSAALVNQAVHVQNILGGSGETKTSLYGETLHFDVLPGYTYWFNASRPGYQDYNETYTIPATPGIYNVYMERILTPIANHSYAHFSVVDQTNGGLIPNAEIRLSDGQTKLTNSAGYAWFSVHNSEQINYYVSKPSGYWPAYGAMNLTADESILVALQRYTGPTATATMPGWTPVTVPTTGTGVDPVVTLSAQLRQQNVQEGMDVWYTNLPFISQFLFLLFIIGGLGLMAGGTRRN